MKKSKVNFLLMMIIFTLIASILIIGGLYVVSMYYYAAFISASPISYADLRPSQYATSIYDYNGNPLDKIHGEENREFAPLEDMPENLKNAVIAMEDKRFYQHPGIDLHSIMRAIYVNLREGAFIEGASTITQQLIKNNLLKDTSVELTRKFDEQIIALKLENDLAAKLGTKKKAKEFILEQYLNSVNLAHGVNGFKLAANYYFGKELKDLTMLECASLAAIIKNPVRFSPINALDKNLERAELILHKMLEQNLITYREYDAALKEEITAAEHPQSNTVVHSFFIDQVINDVARDLMYEKGLDRLSAYNLVYGGGLSIYTTFDPEIQAIVDNAFNDPSLFPQNGAEIMVYATFYTLQGVVEKSTVVHSEGEIEGFLAQQREVLTQAGYTIESETVQKSPQPQGAFAIMDYKTGHVPAIGAGRGEKTYNMAFNRATQSKRQPGSCFKVLAAYLPALDTGVITPDSLIDDAPYTVGGYSPNNYDFRYRGQIPVRTAIRDSINVAAVKTLVETGYETAFAYLEKLGFTTLVRNRTAENGGTYTDMGPALALGGLTDGVTPLELTGAFGAIANNGTYVKPVFYTTVLDHDGTVLLENTGEGVPVLKPGTAVVLTDMMQDVVKRGTGTQAAFRQINVPIAGKTGTSTDDKDLSFGGYTPFYAASVWQGYDIPKKLNYDRNYHLLLWRQIMEEVHILKGYTEGSFVIPDNMSDRDLGRVSAPRANTSTSSAPPAQAPSPQQPDDAQEPQPPEDNLQPEIQEGLTLPDTGETRENLLEDNPPDTAPQEAEPPPAIEAPPIQEPAIYQEFQNIQPPNIEADASNEYNTLPQ